MLKIRLAKKIGANVIRPARTKRAARFSRESRFEGGNTMLTRHEMTSSVYTTGKSERERRASAVQFAASTNTSTARTTSEGFTQVAPKRRLNWIILLVSNKRKAIPKKTKASFADRSAAPRADRPPGRAVRC